MWLVTRYDDIRAGLSDPRLSHDPVLADAVTRAVPWVGAATASARHMARMDPSDHTRMRGLVAKAFTVRRIEAHAANRCTVTRNPECGFWVLTVR